MPYHPQATPGARGRRPSWPAFSLLVLCLLASAQESAAEAEPAIASTAIPAPPVLLAPPAPLEEPAPSPLDPTPRFLGGEPDDEILARICQQPLQSVSPLGGGSSISLKMVFADGSRAAVKPDQTKVTKYASEVAAYRVSRALGLDRVAPSCVRRFTREQLMTGMPQYMRTRMETELRVDRDGMVPCAVIHWIPDLHGLNLERQTWWQPALRRGAAIPAGKRRRLLEISSLLLLDYLIINDDRWSGGNTHTVGDHMVYVDQGAGFGSDRAGRRGFVFSQLRWSQRFDRRVAEALFSLDEAALTAELRELLPPSDVSEFGERLAEARRYLETLYREAPQDSLLWADPPPP